MKNKQDSFKKISLINGPNLNLLGEREVEKYGQVNLKELLIHLKTIAKKNQIDLISFQSNSEGDIVDFIQKKKDVNHCIINAGAYTHTSVAIYDAFLATQVSFIEVHITNIYKRESFRQHSYLSPIAIGTISGFGIYGYEMALHYLIENNSH